MYTYHAIIFQPLLALKQSHTGLQSRGETGSGQCYRLAVKPRKQCSDLSNCRAVVAEAQGPAEPLWRVPEQAIVTCPGGSQLNQLDLTHTASGLYPAVAPVNTQKENACSKPFRGNHLQQKGSVQSGQFVPGPGCALYAGKSSRQGARTEIDWHRLRTVQGPKLSQGILRGQ